jgi:hypothetical protein
MYSLIDKALNLTPDYSGIADIDKKDFNAVLSILEEAIDLNPDYKNI